MARTLQSVREEDQKNYGLAYQEYSQMRASIGLSKYKIGKEHQAKAKKHIDNILIGYRIPLKGRGIRVVDHRKEGATSSTKKAAIALEKKVDSYTQVLLAGEKRENVENLIKFWAK